MATYFSGGVSSDSGLGSGSFVSVLTAAPAPSSGTQAEPSHVVHFCFWVPLQSGQIL
jgi:hypothetical protein